MKSSFYFLLLSLCLGQLSVAQSSVDSVLIKELYSMVKIDQLAATNAIPPEQFSDLSLNQWRIKKDSIYRAHHMRLEQILNQYGYPGYDVLGKPSSYLFWVMVQHADHDPEFQKRVLNLMRAEVEANNADARDFAYLTDRVQINTGEKQIYGTQVTHNLISGKAKSRPTIDPDHLNERRAAVGLEPIEDYLKMSTQTHMANNSIIGGVTNVALLLLLGLVLISTCLSLILRRLRKRKLQRLFN